MKRSRRHLEKLNLGLEEALINLKGLTRNVSYFRWAKNFNFGDFADLASDELTGGYDVIKNERVKIQGYLEDFALSKEEADELIMSARNIVYKDWVMRYGKQKNKISNFWHSQKIDQNIDIAKTQGKNSSNRKIKREYFKEVLLELQGLV